MFTRKDDLMNSEPSGSMVFDTGVLVEIVSGSSLGAYTKMLLRSNAINAYTNEMNIGELRYIICRKSNQQESEIVVNGLVESGYFNVSTASEFMNSAAAMKCERSLAFPDCFVLSIGETMKIPVVFAGREIELIREVRKKPFKTEILFLEDLMKHRGKEKQKSL